MALDTDIKNPDSHLQVTFYSREVKNNFKTEEKAAELGIELDNLEPHHFVNDSVDYLRIDIPGNQNLTIDTPARKEHMKRFPHHWAAYKNSKDAYSSVAGMPIEQWPRVMVNPEMAVELRGLRFNTVQAVAGASDAQLQSIGMVAGQNAFTFRDEARKFLAVSEAESKLGEADKKHSEADAKLAEANAKIAAQAEQHAKDMAELKAQMQQFMANAAGQKDDEVRKPGRPSTGNGTR